jgi:hypothetical protein
MIRNLLYLVASTYQNTRCISENNLTIPETPNGAQAPGSPIVFFLLKVSKFEFEHFKKL